MDNKKLMDSFIVNIPEYKENVINALLQNERLKRLVFINEKDALTRKLENKYLDKLVKEDKNKQITRTQFNPVIYEDTKTRIAVTVGRITQFEGSFRTYTSYVQGAINIYVYTHMDLQDIDEGSRVDFLLIEIYKTLLKYDKENYGTKESNKWMGDLKIEYIDPIIHNNSKLSGYLISLGVAGFK